MGLPVDHGGNTKSKQGKMSDFFRILVTNLMLTTQQQTDNVVGNPQTKMAASGELGQRRIQVAITKHERS